MKITLSRLNTKDLATLAERIIMSSKSGDYAITENRVLLSEVEKQYSKYDKVYAKQTYSGKGVDVSRADKARDKIFNNLKAFLNGYRRINTVPNFQDAEELYNIFKHFGLSINRLSYANETAQMKKLIEALDTEENNEKLRRLHLFDAFSALKAAQSYFELLYSEQIEANANLRSLSSASVVRKELEKSLRNYIDLLTAMREVPGWEMIYADINEIVKSIANK